MHIILITHAQAEKDHPRALTSLGRNHVQRAAKRLLDWRRDCHVNLDLSRLIAVTSEAQRCQDTAEVFLAALEAGSTPVIRDAALTERRGEALSAQTLESVIHRHAREHPPSALLLSVHGDLAGAMPAQGGPLCLVEQASDGRRFFQCRPVFTVVNYQPGTSCQAAELLCCEALYRGRWLSLLATSSRQRGLDVYERLFGKQKDLAKADILDWHTIDHLFAQLWACDEHLSIENRSRITVAILTVLGRDRELETHLRGALRLRISREELEEIMLHVAHYAGWPVGHHGLEVLAALAEGEAPRAESVKRS